LQVFHHELSISAMSFTRAANMAELLGSVPLQIGGNHDIGECVGNNAPYLIVQRPPWRATGVRSRTRAIGVPVRSVGGETRVSKVKSYTHKR
jgi:hypothetical protein